MTNSNSTFTYDKDNNLVSVVSSPQTTTYVWDGADYLAEETGGSLDVVYSTMNGQLVEENRGGVVTEYVPDTLGSVIKTTNSSGTVTSSTTFWPYGETNTSAGTNPSNFGFVGTWGYYTDSTSTTGSQPLIPTRIYIRARTYRPDLSRWLTVDPLWPNQPVYNYVFGDPVANLDGTGEGCYTCALVLYNSWRNSVAHRSSNTLWHQYVHCMSCCIIAHQFGKDCAYSAQRLQISYTKFKNHIRVDTYRRLSCDYGVHVGLARGGSIIPYRNLQEMCSAGCAVAGQYPISSFWPLKKRRGNPLVEPVGTPGPGAPPPALPPYPFACDDTDVCPQPRYRIIF